MNAHSALLAQVRDTATVAGGTVPARPSPGARPSGRARGDTDATDPVVSAAVLVAAAFRLRDEAGLIATLRLLTEAVTDMEARQEAEEDGRTMAVA